MIKWEEIKIKDCGEPLIDIAKTCPELVINLEKKRMRKEGTAFLRKSVAEMICRAKSYLPKGVTFIIGDAWRPKYIQEDILKSFYNKFQKQHHKWSSQRISEEVSKYAAPAEGPAVSGHMAGGAVDLRLWKNGRKIPMKSKKLSYQENAETVQPKLPKFIRQNRKILSDALLKAGLSNYPEEYWHWSYGDIQWAKRNNKKQAKYGTVDKES